MVRCGTQDRDTPQEKGPGTMPELACHNSENQHLFFSENEEDQIAAAKLCAGCPFFQECARLGKGYEYGVWGGKTQWERATLKGTVTRNKRAWQVMAGAHSNGPQIMDSEKREERNARIRSLRHKGATYSDLSLEFELHEKMIARICAA